MIRSGMKIFLRILILCKVSELKRNEYIRLKNNGNEVYALMERSDIIRHSFFLMKRTNKSYSVQGGEENSLFNLKGEAKMNGNIQAICAIVMVIIEAIRLYREIKKGSDDKSEPFSF